MFPSKNVDHTRAGTVAPEALSVRESILDDHERSNRDLVDGHNSPLSRLYNTLHDLTILAQVSRRSQGRSRSYSYPRRCPCQRSPNRAGARTGQHVDELRRILEDRRGARNDVLVRANLQISRKPKHPYDLRAQSKTKRPVPPPFVILYVTPVRGHATMPTHQQRSGILTRRRPEHAPIVEWYGS